MFIENPCPNWFYELDGTPIDQTSKIDFKKFVGIYCTMSISRPIITLSWYKNGLRHREDGPAIEDSNGSIRYFLYGEACSEEQYNLLIGILKLKNMLNP